MVLWLSKRNFAWNETDVNECLNFPQAFEQWKKGPVLLFRVFVGDEKLPRYVGIIEQTIARIPITNQDSTESKGLPFFS